MVGSQPTTPLHACPVIVCDQFLRKRQNPEEGIIQHVSTYTFDTEQFGPAHHAFIQKYEWLGTVGVRPRWLFTARDRGELVALVGLNEPNAYSKVLRCGDPIETQCLIQRGASSVTAHQHTGSKLIMMALRWMIQHTKKRVFFGYSDLRAGEMGTIYSACNFEFLGWNFGTQTMYRHPTFTRGQPFSSQIFNRTTWIKKFLRDQGIQWQPKWSRANGFKDLKAIPPEVKNLWRDYGRRVIKESEAIALPPKGKWIKVLGVNRTEQRMLDAAKLYKIHPHPRRDDPDLTAQFERWRGFMQHLKQSEPEPSTLDHLFT